MIKDESLLAVVCVLGVGRGDRGRGRRIPQELEPQVAIQFLLRKILTEIHILLFSLLRIRFVDNQMFSYFRIFNLSF